MNRRTGIVVVTALTFAVLVLLGLWVGLCETFGGYVWRKQMFFWIALLIGLLGAVAVRRQFKVHSAFAVGVFMLSMVAYGFGTGVGETLYFGPKDLTDFARLFVLAINNQL